ncbi:MAG: hypothetical protein ABW328_00465 [Ilumatobacteraceae bacterium]
MSWTLGSFPVIDAGVVGPSVLAADVVAGGAVAGGAVPTVAGGAGLTAVGAGTGSLTVAGRLGPEAVTSALVAAESSSAPQATAIAARATAPASRTSRRTCGLVTA